jgi:hypothetical protein
LTWALKGRASEGPLERMFESARAMRALTFSVFMLLPIIAEGCRVWASKRIHNLALRGGALAGGLPVSKERRLIRLEGASFIWLQAMARKLIDVHFTLPDVALHAQQNTHAYKTTSGWGS